MGRLPHAGEESDNTGAVQSPIIDAYLLVWARLTSATVITQGK